MDRDAIESLWTAFSVETEEHLETIEPLLAAIDGPRPSDEVIATLFRSFHSIKGLSRAMSLQAMETLSHRAESLLGRVRDEGHALGDDAVTVLLEAVDALRELRGRSIEERQDRPVPEALVTRLEALAAASSPQAETTTVTAPVAPAPPPSSLVGDPDMARYFAELLRPQLPPLAAVLRRVFAEVPAPPADDLRMLDTMEHAASVMNFYNMAALLKALKDVLTEPALRPAERRRRLVHLVCEFENDLRLIQTETGEDAGAATLVTELAAVLPAVRTVARAAFAEAWSTFEADPAPRSAHAAARAAEDLGAVHELLLADAATAQLCLLVDDVLSRAAHGELTVAGPLKEALGTAAAAMTDDGTAADAVAPLRRALIDGLGGPGAAPARDAALQALRQERVPDDLLALLTPQNLDDAAAAIADGCTAVHVVEADLNASREVARGFVDWARSGARALTNRTLFADGRTLFQFLLLSRQGADQVAETLAALDPSGRLLTLRRSAPARDAAPATPTDDGRKVTVIRVPGETIDLFMAQIGEMVLARSGLGMALADEAVAAARAAVTTLVEKHRITHPADDVTPAVLQLLELLERQEERLRQSDQMMHGALQRLQERALDLRVLPIDTVFSRFPRVVRDIARQTGKTVRLELTGREVRIDKGMVELLLDPLMHMVRNAVDHGIESPAERRAAGKPETGLIRLNAVQRGSRVVIEIVDDGRGLDAARIRAKAAERGLMDPATLDALPDEEVYRLIFRPGFSTAAEVTETSGRGVGMDVVHTNIVARLGGQIAIRSSLGGGSVFTLSLPLSAAIQDALLVEAAGQVFAIPDRWLMEIQEVPETEVQSVRGQRAMVLRDGTLAIHHLATLLGRRPGAHKPGQPLPVVVVGNGRGALGLEVDRLYRRQELYVKDLHPCLTALPGVGGASVLGDGRVVVILDVEDLFALAARSRPDAALPAAALPAAAE